MDVLSRLLELSRLQPALDIRCRLQGNFVIDHDPAEKGTIPFHLILDGQCRIRTASGQVATMQSGDFLLLPRGGAHAIISVDATGPVPLLHVTREGMLPLRQSGDTAPDVDLLCGHFDCVPGSSNLLLDTLPDVFQVSLISGRSEETLRALVALLRREADHQEPGALTVVTAMCLALFVMALRARSTSSFEAPGLLPLLADARLAKSVRAVMAAPAQAWTIETLAELSAMSRATYARQFKDCAGMTVGTFLTELRMTLASHSLLQTRRTVADIAAEVGYLSEAAFGKAFKASIGSTPARYRQS